MLFFELEYHNVHGARMRWRARRRFVVALKGFALVALKWLR
jgi:hypothetical protein